MSKQKRRATKKRNDKKPDRMSLREWADQFTHPDNFNHYIFFNGEEWVEVDESENHEEVHCEQAEA